MGRGILPQGISKPVRWGRGSSKRRIPQCQEGAEGLGRGLESRGLKAGGARKGGAHLNLLMNETSIPSNESLRKIREIKEKPDLKGV